MGMPTSVRQLLFCRWHLLISGPSAHLFGTLVKINNVFQPSDALLTSHIRGASIITLICTRHAYLTSSHLRFLLCQNTTEQLFLKIPFLKARAPCSTIAYMYLQCPHWLTHYSPRGPTEARKKESCWWNTQL
jgi:hypothetical protein